VQHHPRDQRVCCLSRCRDDNLAGLGPDSAMLDELARNCLLQGRTVLLAETAEGGCSRSTAQAPRPDIVGKFPDVGQSRDERPRLTLSHERPGRLAYSPGPG